MRFHFGSYASEIPLFYFECKEIEIKEIQNNDHDHYIFIIVITIVIIIYLIKQVTCKEAFTATQLPPFKVNHSTARDLHNQPRSQGSWNEVCTYSSLRTVLWVPSFAFHKNQNSERAVRRGLSHGFSPHPRRLPMYIRTKTFSAVGPVGI